MLGTEEGDDDGGMGGWEDVIAQNGHVGDERGAVIISEVFIDASLSFLELSYLIWMQCVGES